MNGVDGLAGLRERLERLESESAIRTLMAQYFDLCDRLGDATPADALGMLFTADAVWAGTGTRYAEAFGEHRGRDAIVAMLDTYRGPPPHFAMNAHFLANERIAVDGDRASGSWLMLQTSSYAAGGADLRAARLQIAFERSSERWRIRRLETQRLFGRQIDTWDDAAPIPVPGTT
jgi:hypothetical protein